MRACVNPNTSFPNHIRIHSGSEFAHEHRVDGSWHVVLAPLDAHRVCSTGWGERGPPIVCKNLCQHFDFAPTGLLNCQLQSRDNKLTVPTSPFADRLGISVRASERE